MWGVLGLGKRVSLWIKGGRKGSRSENIVGPEKMDLGGGGVGQQSNPRSGDSLPGAQESSGKTGNGTRAQEGRSVLSETLKTMGDTQNGVVWGQQG